MIGDTAYVNQRVAPDGFTDGRGWEYLGLVEMTGTTLTHPAVRRANGYVVADAVRIDVPHALHLGVAERTDSPAAPTDGGRPPRRPWPKRWRCGSRRA